MLKDAHFDLKKETSPIVGDEIFCFFPVPVSVTNLKQCRFDLTRG